MLGLARRGVAPGRPRRRRGPWPAPTTLRAARATVDATRVADEVARYVVDVVRRTRELPSVDARRAPRARRSTCSARRRPRPARRPRLRHARRRRRAWRRRCCATGSCSRPEAELERYGPDDAVRTALGDRARPAVSPTARRRRAGRLRAPALAARCSSCVGPRGRRADRRGARARRRAPSPTRSPCARGRGSSGGCAPILARGVAAPLDGRGRAAPAPGRVRVRQPHPAGPRARPARGGRRARRAADRRCGAAATRSPAAAARTEGPLRPRPLGPPRRRGRTSCSSIPTCPRPAGSRSPCARAASASRAARRAGRSASARSSSRSATTCPTTTSARSTGGRRRGSGGR